MRRGVGSRKKKAFNTLPHFLRISFLSLTKLHTAYDSPDQKDLLHSEVQGGVLQQNWTSATVGFKVMSGNGWGQGRGA